MATMQGGGPVARRDSHDAGRWLSGAVELSARPETGWQLQPDPLKGHCIKEGEGSPPMEARQLHRVSLQGSSR